MLSGHFCARWFLLKPFMYKCVKLILELQWAKPLQGYARLYNHLSALGDLSRKWVEVVKKALVVRHCGISIL